LLAVPEAVVRQHQCQARQYLAVGITEDIITAPTRFRWFLDDHRGSTLQIVVVDLPRPQAPGRATAVRSVHVATLGGRGVYLTQRGYFIGSDVATAAGRTFI
jgi:hypothetical protein